MSKAFPLWCAVAVGAMVPVSMFAQRAGTQGSNTASPVVPVQMPRSIGLSPQSIGLSPRSIGTSPNSVPVNRGPIVAPGVRRNSGNPTGRHRDRNAPGAFLAAPLFLPYVDNSVPVDAAAAPTQAPEGDTVALSDQLKQLSQQLRDLQDQLAHNTPPPVPEQAGADEEPSEPPPAPAITIVLKNGQSFQTRNYAVTGGTFWDLSSDPARKVAVNSIDAAASQKATAANGAELPSMAAGQQ